MDSKEQEIKKLKTKRFNLREKIRKYVKEGKNAYEFVIEFHEVIRKLQELGFNASIEKDYLHLEYWDKFSQKSNQIKNESKHQSIPLKSVKQEKINKKSDSFAICLAWTSIEGFVVPIQVQKVKEYFNELGLELESDNSKSCGPQCTEHILKYVFEGPEDSFRLLKTCTQFVLDSFAESDFDRFNIAVYGKRKNY